jgi:ribosomal protein L2
MRKRKLTKAQSQTVHFKRRSSERLGIDLNRHVRRELINKIQRGNLKFIKKQSLRVSIFEAEIEGKICHLVYDKNRKKLVTVLLAGEEKENIWKDVDKTD